MRFAIERLAQDDATVAALADLLVETVANGGSVNFMHPLAEADAAAFWRAHLAVPANIVLGAREGGALVATVTLHRVAKPNQPHRAEIAKLMTRVAYRGRGVGAALMAEAERLALADGRTLLTLDTAEDEGAAGFYERLGYERCGRIADYALRPHGRLSAALIYAKRLAA
jgi:ribosomal protein S18 acetylase RimI-like enzyme